MAVAFGVPQVAENLDGWGPDSSSVPSQLEHVPYAPFSKGDRVDRASDWTGQAFKYNQEIRGMAAMMSPKRPLSLSRDLLDAVQTTGPKQGAKPTEVYGFVGAISTLVGFVVFLVWAYLPEPWLHSMGITYYPNRYWAMAIPAYVLVAIAFVVLFYTSLNYMATPPPCSFNSLFDEYTRGPFRTSQLLHAEADQPIHAISDVPITAVNALVFGGLER